MSANYGYEVGSNLFENAAANAAYPSDKALTPMQAKLLGQALGGMGKPVNQVVNGAMPAPVSPEEGTTTWEDLLRWWYSRPQPGDHAMTVRG